MMPTIQVDPVMSEGFEAHVDPISGRTFYLHTPSGRTQVRAFLALTRTRTPTLALNLRTHLGARHAHHRFVHRPA